MDEVADCFPDFIYYILYMRTIGTTPEKNIFNFFTPSGLFTGQYMRCQNFYMPFYE